MNSIRSHKRGRNRGRQAGAPIDPGGGECGVVALKIVGGEEQEHARARPIADETRVIGRGGAGEDELILQPPFLPSPDVAALADAAFDRGRLGES